SNDNETFEIVEKTKADPKLELTVEDTLIKVTLNESATGDVIITIGDISFIKEASTLITINASEYLTNGTYDVKVAYAGDEKFTNDTKTGSVTIPEEEVIEPKDVNLKLTVEDTVITVSLNDTATGLVIITVGDISFVQDAGELTPIDVSEYLTNGTYPVEVTYVGDEVFANASETGELTIPDEPVVEPKDANLKVDVKDTVVTVSLNDTATGLVIITVGDISFVQDAGELAPIDVSEYLTNGTYPVEVTYVGDDVFSNDTKTGELTVPSEPVVELKDPELKFVAFEDNEAIISLNKNATGLVLVSINGGWINNFYECDGNDIYIYVPDDSETIDVVYLGDEIFKNATISFTYEAAELENANLKATAENTTITITVDKDATGYVYVDVDGKGFYAELNDGKAVIDVIGLGAGNYTASVTYAGDDNFANDSASVVISVSEESVENDTNVSEPVVPDMGVNVTNSTISVELPADATGYVLVDVNGTGYYAPVKDGKAVIDIIGLDAGSYPVNIMYVGDDKYSGSNATDTVVISKEEDKPAENESKPVDSEAKINVSEDAVSIELPEDATGYMLVDVDGTGYYVPVKDGKATLDLPELASGNHTVSVTYTGDKKYAPANSTQTVEVELKESIVSQDLTKVERAPDRFAATFLDENGNPLANANVTFDVNGAVYTRTTDANGESSIAINLIAGNYTITLTNPATGEVKTNNIVVLSRFAEDADLVKYYRNDSQYVLKLLDDDGNPAKAGEIVTYNINGVFYNRTTNATGHVQLNINLQPGEYVITAIYKGCQVAHKVTVLPVLTATDLTKKFGQSGAFEAKLVDGQGKAYAGKNIGFNINGVFYNRTTDDNGVARLNINLLPGEYVITSSYGQALASNKVTVTA
ncbi:MAG: Ig-like domain repeat protein, partial [Methanobrevibacter sp.]|nr:Ig-like domain repeat protein [Methanobrevibacter sp.]